MFSGRMQHLVKDCVAFYGELDVFVMCNSATDLVKRWLLFSVISDQFTFSKMSRSELTVRSPFRTTSKTFMLGALKYTSLIFSTRR